MRKVGRSNPLAGLNISVCNDQIMALVALRCLISVRNARVTDARAIQEQVPRRTRVQLNAKGVYSNDVVQLPRRLTKFGTNLFNQVAVVSKSPTQLILASGQVEAFGG